MLTSGLRRAGAPLASRAQLSQRRFGGSLHKNKHIEVGRAVRRSLSFWGGKQR